MINSFAITADAFMPYPVKEGYNYAWIRNAGETTFYVAPLEAFLPAPVRSVEQEIAYYLNGQSKDIVQIPPSCATRISANTSTFIMFSEDDALSEIILTNNDTCPFV